MCAVLCLRRVRRLFCVFRLLLAVLALAAKRQTAPSESGLPFFLTGMVRSGPVWLGVELLVWPPHAPPSLLLVFSRAVLRFQPADSAPSRCEEKRDADTSLLEPVSARLGPEGPAAATVCGGNRSRWSRTREPPRTDDLSRARAFSPVGCSQPRTNRLQLSLATHNRSPGPSWTWTLQ